MTAPIVPPPRQRARDCELPKDLYGKIVRGYQDRRDLWKYRGLMPQFLGLGAYKGGTTWLHACLAVHPACFVPPFKDLHYFDWNVDKRLDTYLREFEEGRGKLIGEMTPAYGSVPLKVIRYIHWLNPQMKYILIMRNPVDREWSHFLMDVVKHRERPFEELTDAEFHDHFDRPYTIKLADYAWLIERWASIVGRENILTLFYDDIKTRPRALIEDVYKFLGLGLDIDWAQVPYDKVIHEGLRIPIPERWREYLREKYRPFVDKLAEEFGDKARIWLEPQG